jgi:hypothetical protein
MRLIIFLNLIFLFMLTYSKAILDHTDSETETLKNSILKTTATDDKQMPEIGW